MSRPFFSVVIPTKGRSFLVGYAVRSVLQQTFGDLELVLVDNDDGDATREVVRTFHDPRIRYHRTGGLPMTDNWEFGVSRAEGEYVAILEDKQVLKRGALERIHALVERSRPASVSWPFDRVAEVGPLKIVGRAPGDGGSQVLASEEVLRTFLKEGSDAWYRVMPLGISACYHRRVLEAARAGPVGRTCPGNSPDFTMAFLALAYGDEVVNVEAGLAVEWGRRFSSGRDFQVKGPVSRAILAARGDVGYLYDRVPIKAVYIVANTLYNDYERIRAQVGGRLAAFPLDLPSYFVQCRADIDASKRKGGDMTDEERGFEAALAAQPEEVRAEVRRRLAADRKKRLGKALRLDKIWMVARHLPRRVLFADVLAYVDYEHTHGGGVGRVEHVEAWRAAASRA